MTKYQSLGLTILSLVKPPQYVDVNILWYLYTLLSKVFGINNLHLEHVKLPHVLDLAVHLVNFFC